MKYCVAVSGGCDSMTLLDKCVKKGLDVIVAHVNYQKRESAWRDEEIVRQFCEQNRVPFFVKYCPTVYKGNFQGYARKFRYDFFRDFCYDGMKRRYPENMHEKVSERLEYELGVIEKMGFIDYFLIVSDFIKYAKEQNITEIHLTTNTFQAPAFYQSIGFSKHLIASVSSVLSFHSLCVVFIEL